MIVQSKFFFGAGYSLGLTSAAEDDEDVKHKVIHVYVGVSFPFGVPTGM